MFNITAYLDARRKLIEKALKAALPPASCPPQSLHAAMRYSVLSGGKRLRAIICLASAEAAGGKADHAVLAAVAVELLHAYTLIHDDLPCMDDDNTRRGKPSCHIAFGPATAILAGDALQALAFETAAGCAPLPPYDTAAVVVELARAAGSRGVAGGQVDDLAATSRSVTRRIIRSIHARKTAALFAAAARMGATCAGASRSALDALTTYATNFGLAFQIADDISDRKHPSKKIKTKLDNSSCLLVYASRDACRYGQRLLDKAVHALAPLPRERTHPLTELAGMLKVKLG